MHIRHDLFVVTGSANAADILAAVRALNYEPKIVDKEKILAATPAPGELTEVPEYVRRVLDQAKTERKLVVFDCYAEWCLPCKRMLNETFADPRIKKLMDEQCVFVKVDVEKTPEIAKYFETAGIPDI